MYKHLTHSFNAYSNPIGHDPVRKEDTEAQRHSKLAPDRPAPSDEPRFSHRGHGAQRQYSPHFLLKELTPPLQILPTFISYTFPQRLVTKFLNTQLDLID